MAAQIIDGKLIAEHVRNEVAAEVAERSKAGKKAPGLATVLVGDNTASRSYVSSKQKACKEVGINSFGYDLPATATQKEVEDLVTRLNEDDAVNGILVQLPLPAGLDEERVLKLISVEKDVDGFHPINIGRLAQKGRDPLFVPCTPIGVIHLLKTVLPSLEGVNAVVLGRSNIVGMPVALLLIRENATVTVCHSRTPNIADYTRQADILIAAIGKAEFVTADMVKKGAVVIDVGINRVADRNSPKGHKLVGDVKYAEVAEKASWITPVPGGVGPMTIAMLMHNAVKACKQQNGL